MPRCTASYTGTRWSKQWNEESDILPNNGQKSKLKFHFDSVFNQTLNLKPGAGCHKLQICRRTLNWPFIENSMKTGWLWSRALRKKDCYRWKLYERRIAFVESSTKAGLLSLKALWKKDSFRWKLYESRMAFVESSTKEGLLLLKALRKQALWEQDGFSWKPCESLSKSA